MYMSISLNSSLGACTYLNATVYIVMWCCQSLPGYALWGFAILHVSNSTWNIYGTDKMTYVDDAQWAQEIAVS